MRFKIYKSSGLATFVSIIGAVTCYAGILSLFAKEFLVGIICIVIGFVIQIGAGEIADKAAFKKWKKEVVSKGYAQLVVQGNYSVAVQLYNQNPGEKTLKYFETLNTNVASRLRGAVQANSANSKPEQAASKPAANVHSARASSGQGVRCGGCGAVLAAGDTFCTQCGNRVTQVKKCQRCGSKLGEDAKFCYECGFRI